MTIRAAAYEAARPISPLGELGRWIASRLAVYLAAAILSALLFFGWAFVFMHFWPEQSPSNEPARFETPLPKERPKGSPESLDWALFAAERLDRAPIAKQLVWHHAFPEDALKKKAAEIDESDYGNVYANDYSSFGSRRDAQLR